MPSSSTRSISGGVPSIIETAVARSPRSALGHGRPFAVTSTVFEAAGARPRCPSDLQSGAVRLLRSALGPRATVRRYQHGSAAGRTVSAALSDLQSGAVRVRCVRHCAPRAAARCYQHIQAAGRIGFGAACAISKRRGAFTARATRCTLATTCPISSNRRGAPAAFTTSAPRRPLVASRAIFKPARRALTTLHAADHARRFFECRAGALALLLRGGASGSTSHVVRRRPARFAFARERAFWRAAHAVRARLRVLPAGRFSPDEAPAPSPRGLHSGLPSTISAPAGFVRPMRFDVLLLRAGARSDEAGRGCLAVNLSRMKSHTAIARSSSVST